MNLRVEDVVLDGAVGIRSLVVGGGPSSLDLLKQAVLVLLGSLLNLLTLGSEVGRELVGVPGVVWASDVVVPVLLDKVRELLAVGGLWERNVVVGQPPFKLSLVPFVVSSLANGGASDCRVGSKGHEDRSRK